MRYAAAAVLLAATSLGCGESVKDAQKLHADSVAAIMERAERDIQKDSVPLMIAGNTEPFWRVDVTSGGLVYLPTQQGGAVRFPPGRVDGGDSASVWKSTRTGAGPKVLELHLLRFVCHDPKNPANTFPYSAELVLDGRPGIHGCATPTGLNRLSTP